MPTATTAAAAAADFEGLWQETAYVMYIINCLLNTRTLIILSLGAYPSQAAAACTHAYAHCAAYAVDADASMPERRKECLRKPKPMYMFDILTN